MDIRRKFIAILCCVGLAGCGWTTGEEPDAPLRETEPQTATLRVCHEKNGAIRDAIEAACVRFGDETGIDVELYNFEGNYEETIKNFMASNNLPDIFTTHGWSIKRYSVYLRPLNDQSWEGDIKPGVKAIITDSGGRFYVLPVTFQQEGLIYHAGVLEQCGIDPDSIRTWGDFEQSLARIREQGFLPLSFGGKDSWTIAFMLNYLCTGYMDRDSMSAVRADLLENNMDWSSMKPMFDMVASWVDNGYIDPECLLKDQQTAIEEFAMGGVAFSPGSGIHDALPINPDARFGVIPIPAFDKDQEPFLISGEDLAFGVWKDTQMEAEALTFLEHMAQPEMCAMIAEVAMVPSGLSGAAPAENMLSAQYHQYEGLRRLEYFDRAYLPNGMWTDFCAASALLVSGKPDAAQESIALLESSYRERMG